MGEWDMVTEIRMRLSDLFAGRLSFKDSRILEGGIDRHSHILFASDDGVSSLEESLEVLAYEETLGIREVWCTPHVMEDMPNGTDVLKERFSRLCAAYDGPIKLCLAAEYMLDNIFEERLARKDLLTMEDDILLVETSAYAPPVNMIQMLRDVMKAGYRPMIAHPERYLYLDRGLQEELAGMGVLFQLNLPSLVKSYGGTACSKAMRLLKRGGYSCVGTDCHRLSALKGQMERSALTRETVSYLMCISDKSDAYERDN